MTTDFMTIDYDDITASERRLIVAYIRTIELEYMMEVEALKPHAHGPKSPAWTDYVAAVSKASMARVLAAKIERGDHRKPVKRKSTGECPVCGPHAGKPV